MIFDVLESLFNIIICKFLVTDLVSVLVYELLQYISVRQGIFL